MPARRPVLCPRTRRPGVPARAPSCAAHARARRPYAGVEAGDARGARAQCGRPWRGRHAAGRARGGGGGSGGGRPSPLGPEDGCGRTLVGTPDSAPAARPRHPANVSRAVLVTSALRGPMGAAGWGGPAHVRPDFGLISIMMRSQPHLHGVAVGEGSKVLGPGGSAGEAPEP